MDPVVERLVRDLSVDKASLHTDFLVNRIGERIAGTAKMEEAARHIRDQPQSYGLETRIDRFPIYPSYPKGASLRATSIRIASSPTT